uniref:Uncharacterized protein n=1 Tax=uncultured bacterium contig00040 TaxID=1181528 RepID=A0A806KJ54_9BACT|nr:hypothetical protein [uncultured bacterium contig00040]
MPDVLSTVGANCVRPLCKRLPAIWANTVRPYKRPPSIGGYFGVLNRYLS